MRRFVLLFAGITALTAASLAQTQTPLPTDPGMYVEVAGTLTKIIGQIAEFKRSGSLFASHATVGIKSQKENIQLLGPHAQTVVSSLPVFYFLRSRRQKRESMLATSFWYVSRKSPNADSLKSLLTVHGAAVLASPLPTKSKYSGRR